MLTELVIDEVSLVRRGADQDAHVVLHKSADPRRSEETPPMTIDLTPAVAKALEGIDTSGLSPEIVAALNATFATPEAPAAAESTIETEAAPTGGGDVTTAEATAGETSPEGEPVVKTAEQVALEKRLADAEGRIAEMTKAAEIGALVQKAKVELPALSIDAEEVATVMYRIGKADADVVFKILKAASDAVAEAGTFTEAGSNLGRDDATEFGKIVSKVMADQPSLTRPQAVAKALETAEGRAAYAQERGR